MSLRLSNAHIEATLFMRDGANDEPYHLCEMAYVRRKPCAERITLDANRQPTSGLLVHKAGSRAVRIFCSGKCAARGLK